MTFENIEDFDKKEATINILLAWYNENCDESSKLKSKPKTKEILIENCKVLFARIKEHNEFMEETENLSDEEFKAQMLAEIDAQKVFNKADNASREGSWRASNALGVHNSWQDETTRSKRLKRNKVLAGEKGSELQEYGSTNKAFIALGLPDSRCIRFRMKLKESGCEFFEHNGVVYEFKIVER